MKKMLAVIMAVLVFASLVACEKKASIKFPFELSDVKNIEMFHFINPTEAEKKVITEPEDIESIYRLFESISLKDKATEPVAGGSVTSFRFHLSNDTSYEVIYSEVAGNSGRIISTDMEKDYFTFADVELNWEKYDYKVVNVAENELPMLYEEKEAETLEWDKIPMVMVNGKLYYDTGKESDIDGRCGVMDGKITSTVDGSETPTVDNQSNFGTGFEYQYGADDTIEIFMNKKWIVFEHREGDGSQVRFGETE